MHDRIKLGTYSKLLVFSTINTLILKNEIDASKFEVILTAPTKKMHSECFSQLKIEDVASLEDVLHLMLIQ